MCHMIADTEAELHAMAANIGIARRHYQENHYDICMAMRKLAVGAGAIEITAKQCAAMNRRRIVTGSLGQPEDAIAWYKNRRSESIAAC